MNTGLLKKEHNSYTWEFQWKVGKSYLKELIKNNYKDIVYEEFQNVKVKITMNNVSHNSYIECKGEDNKQ
jgi:hypothetical protein